MLKKESNWADLDVKLRVGKIGQFLMSNTTYIGAFEAWCEQTDCRRRVGCHIGATAFWRAFHGFPKNEVRQDFLDGLSRLSDTCGCFERQERKRGAHIDRGTGSAGFLCKRGENKREQEIKRGS
eukprot:5288696-Heterocapsa_arctica.AAC.1